MSSQVAATASRPPPVQPSVHPLSTVTLSPWQDAATLTARQRSRLAYINPRYATAMDYTPFRLPPSDWIIDRHIGTPAIFRDTLASSCFWTDEQRTAITAALRDWRTAGHPLHGLYGNVTAASISSTGAQQQSATRSLIQQRHTFGFYVNNTAARLDTARDGIIIYDVHLAQHPAAAAFLHGPQHLNCTEYDVWTHSEYGTNLSLVAGQQNTYTALHVDGGSDSVWHLLVEGQKLWILARPESSAKAYASLPSNRTVEWKRITDGVEGWMVDERVMVVVQNAGDLIYIPRDWPHIVKHYTDTLAVSSNVLHAWDLPRALRGVDFTAMSDCDYAMYEQGMDAVRGNERLQLVLRMRMQQLEQLWQQKGREREEAKRRRREEAEAGERETGEGSDEAEGRRQGGKKRKTG